MAYDLANYTVTFTRTPPQLTISAQVLDVTSGAVRGTVSAQFPGDLTSLAQDELREILEGVVRMILHRKVVQAGWS